MIADELFGLLDRNADGMLERSELAEAARELRWHWNEAPFFAVLDYLTIREPLSRDTFEACFESMQRDHHGPYGEVLRTAPHFDDIGRGVASGDTALLIIDPQVSFTRGSWMRSIGPDADTEVEPIRRAFEHCAQLLEHLPSSVDVMFTRCPFPPYCYGWDTDIEPLLEPSQPYFVKPGNSVLWPPTNGFREWVDGLLGRGFTRLVMGGCTLNSCVRISAVEVQQLFGKRGLQVLVDLHLCGARRRNYSRFELFDGLSSADSAVKQMQRAGVEVATGLLRQ